MYGVYSGDPSFQIFVWIRQDSLNDIFLLNRLFGAVLWVVLLLYLLSFAVPAARLDFSGTLYITIHSTIYEGMELSILANFCGWGGVLETAGIVVDRGECTKCIPSLGFGSAFGSTVFAWFEISCTIHTAIKLNVLGNIGIWGWFWTDLDAAWYTALDRGDWELSVTRHVRQNFIVVVQSCWDISCQYMSWMNLS